VAKAGKEPTLVSALTPLLAEIFAQVQRRNPQNLQEVTQAEILQAHREGRLPLISEEVREYRMYCPLAELPKGPVPPLEVLRNQPVPTNIPLAYDWAESWAQWKDPKTEARTEYLKIRGRQDVVDQLWPLNPQSPQECLSKAVDDWVKDGVIKRGIGRRALAKKLKRHLDDAHHRGLVTRSMEETSIYNALPAGQWHLWPVRVK
jgi:hypothetical protein